MTDSGHDHRARGRRRIGPARAAGIGALGLLAVMVAAVLAFGSGRDREPPAPPEVLDRIADKNREAATEAAARMKAESAAAASAADRRAAHRGEGGPEEPLE